MEIFDSKENVDHVAASVPYETIVARTITFGQLLCRSQRHPRDGQHCRAECGLRTTVAKIDQLRADIDAIIAEIEGRSRGVSDGFLEKLLDGAEVEWMPLGKM